MAGAVPFSAIGNPSTCKLAALSIRASVTISRELSRWEFCDLKDQDRSQGDHELLLRWNYASNSMASTRIRVHVDPMGTDMGLMRVASETVTRRF